MVGLGRRRALCGVPAGLRGHHARALYANHADAFGACVSWRLV